ncbi:MAG: hypothetical protein GY747_01890 [Planctomycetes bacterium]|nr:hypothetical protein [Planctomycetota bacterium]MCP4769980.1 hypothetical protein [Planctomycetota bacterium]MCP4859820.1 hypothetical protein [Planctomycetota bacterium]
MPIPTLNAAGWLLACACFLPNSIHAQDPKPSQGSDTPAQEEVPIADEIIVPTTVVKRRHRASARTTSTATGDAHTAGSDRLFFGVMFKAAVDASFWIVAGGLEFFATGTTKGIIRGDGL